MQLEKWKADQLAFEQQALVFELSKYFPREEMFSLTDQIRRSSRSVCANLAEAYRKKRYPSHLLLKLTDADAENEETKTWIEIAAQCKYLSGAELEKLKDQNTQISKLLYYMINHIDKFSHK
ncbi:MAG: four helix bundle protein [Chitinophagaceae bacterium]